MLGKRFKEEDTSSKLHVSNPTATGDNAGVNGDGNDSIIHKIER